MAYNSLKFCVIGLKTSKTNCPFVEGVLLMAISVERVVAPIEKWILDGVTSTDEKYHPWVVEK